MTTTVIHTLRLTLDECTRADAADVFAYASNPNVARFTSWMPHTQLEQSEAFIETILARPAPHHTWAIRTRTDRRMVGAAEFVLVSDQEANLAYVLAEEFWNQGLMTEAVRAVIAWGLATHSKVSQIRAFALAENVGSRRVLEKCGLSLVQIRPIQWPKFTEPVEDAEYVWSRVDTRRHGDYSQNEERA
jgi:ribosomal-protein-alanine N-acetyltransferase